MAHYAFLDENNVVTEVIVGKNEGENGIDWEEYYGNIRGQKCRRTSYNTQGGAHIHGGTPYRMNYAGVGYVFREDVNAPEGAFLPTLPPVVEEIPPEPSVVEEIPPEPSVVEEVPTEPLAADETPIEPPVEE